MFRTAFTAAALAVALTADQEGRKCFIFQWGLTDTLSATSGFVAGHRKAGCATLPLYLYRPHFDTRRSLGTAL
jgi:hypothetical protein